MAFYYGGDAFFVAYTTESGTISESADGLDPASFSVAQPSNPVYVGYTNVPEQKRGLNNSFGYATGSYAAAYRKRGRREPSLSIALRAGSLGLLERINRNSGKLPYLCFYVGVPGVWTDMYRFCKVNSLTLAGREETGEGQEIEATLDVQAMSVQRLASPLNPSLSGMSAALGTPLFWHDTRVCTINGDDYRQALMGFNVQIQHNLERKGCRPFWGDNEPLSNTCYDMLEHLLNVSGTLDLHSQLPSAFVDAAAYSQNWSDIVFSISDGGIEDNTTRSIDLSLFDCFPQDVTAQGVEASAQQTHAVQFLAQNYSLVAAATSGG